MANTEQILDVLIVGAGVSGIGMACHLREQCPDQRFVILEGREAVGGTWDLFRYPGIRSDSDMMTFGYRFAPWNKPQVLADGPAIKGYVARAAEASGVTPHIRFGRKVIAAAWCSDTALWTLTAEHGGQRETWQARFVVGCTGYYNYEKGFRPPFPGESQFKGRIVHPQQWPEDLVTDGQRVLVIGSGATAITLVPNLADAGAQVTMLQRSPGYILSVPSIDPIADRLLRWLPAKLAYRLNRARNVKLQQWLYRAAKAQPKATRRILLALVKKQLQGKVDMRHFTPRYMPWDQRLCVVPDGDLFRVLREGSATIATDTIDTFTANGVRLSSGEEIAADIIVTATGLELQMLGGMMVTVDGAPIESGQRLMYKSVMLEGLPNMAMVFGYINASWTLKADLAADYVCRLLQHMAANGIRQATPLATADDRTEDTMMGSLASGYVQRAAHLLPRQGKRGVWRVAHHYGSDSKLLREAPIEDAGLQFRKAA